MRKIFKSFIFRIIEELFPLPLFYKHQKKKILEINNNDTLKNSNTYKSYSVLEKEELLSRITEEHSRAFLLDEKTSKLTLSISFGFAIIGILSSIFTGMIVNTKMEILVIIFAMLTIVYSLLCSVISIAALRTLPFYGYGTDFLVQTKKSKSIILLALIRQEKMNIIRQMRNETSFMLIRNSFVCFIIIVMTYIYNFFLLYFTNVNSNYV